MTKNRGGHPRWRLNPDKIASAAQRGMAAGRAGHLIAVCPFAAPIAKIEWLEGYLLEITDPLQKRLAIRQVRSLRQQNR